MKPKEGRLMYKKRELLAKALMDSSKIMFAGSLTALMFNQNNGNTPDLITFLFVIIIVGFLAWIIQPEIDRKESYK